MAEQPQGCYEATPLTHMLLAPFFVDAITHMYV